jgi:GNAT superfamily N-acetyltransferase
VRIDELDPFDDEQMAQFHAVYAEADRHGRRYAIPFALAEMAASLRVGSQYEQRLAFFGHENGAMVAVAQLELPLHDNVSQAYGDVHVLPAQRRRGIGALLALHLAGVAREHDRTLWNGWVPGRDVDEPEGTLTPGEHLAARLGMSLGLRDVQRRLALPVPGRRIEDLLASAARHHAGYSFVGWVDHCPAEHVEAYCTLRAAMNSQAPTGDLEVEDEHWDAVRLREEEDLLLASGRTRHAVVAVAPDGTLAGHNELVVPEHDPLVVWQWDTLVLPAHRGHRLGLALKVLNLRDVQSAHPERTDVRTFNADSNTHMVAVNDAIGFVPVSYLGEWQGPVPG